MPEGALEGIDSCESFILKPVSGTHILPETSDENLQMDNCHELVTAHTELFLETNTSNKPRWTVCKREGQEWVTGTSGARAQNGSMNDISGLAGRVCGCSLSFQLLLSVSYQERSRETKKQTNKKPLSTQTFTEATATYFCLCLVVLQHGPSFLRNTSFVWVCVQTVTNPFCGLG